MRKLKNDDVLDIGKGMRDKFNKIRSKKISTLDVNDFGDYPDIIYDICSESMKRWLKNLIK